MRNEIRYLKQEEYQKMEEELAQAEERANRAIERARQEGNRLKDELVNEGREKTEQMLANAKADIAFERNRMLDEVQREIVDATISATEKMLSERIDEETDKRIIDDFIKEITKK